MESIKENPVFGPLVWDQWHEDLLMFREFPHLRAFWVPDRERVLASSYLSAEHPDWVENWESHATELAEVCRRSPVHAGLQSLGVYEVTVAVPPDGTITTSQEAAFRFYGEHEEIICANVLDALMRYYRFARRTRPHFFGDDYPDEPTIDQLSEHIDFDGFLVCRCSSNGLSPLRFAWDLSWDPEHGLAMAVYRDQVIAIGTDDVDHTLANPRSLLRSLLSVCWSGFWNPKQMNEAELQACRKFANGHKRDDA